MTLVKLSVAGVRIEAGGTKDHLDLRIPPCAVSYTDFSALSDSSDLVDIRVIIELGAAQERPMQTLVNEEVGATWFADGRYRRILRRSPSCGVIWDSYFETPLHEATVFVPLTQVQHDGEKQVLPCPVFYPLDQFLLTYHMATRSGAIFHSAGATRDGCSALFIGRSRAGKSTISRQLEAHGGFQVLSDDRIIVRKLASGYTAFGTPWPSEAKIARNESTPLSALFFLHKAPENRIERLNPQLAFERLLPVVSIPWFDHDVFPSVLEYLSKLTADVPAFDLHFKPTPGIADDIDQVLRSVSGS
jgi:hypothetical protein